MITSNKNTQKAFLKGVNGCLEHVEIMQEIIQDAKNKRRTVHVSWYDLEDAFGSVSHVLIDHCLSYYHVPSQVKRYILDLYGKLKGKIVTRD